MWFNELKSMQILLKLYFNVLMPCYFTVFIGKEIALLVLGFKNVQNKFLRFFCKQIYDNKWMHNAKCLKRECVFFLAILAHDATCEADESIRTMARDHCIYSQT